MCGRFSLTIDSDQIREAFPWLNVPDGIHPRYNIAPSQPVAVVPNDGKNSVDFFNWGLIPFWAKDIKIGYKMINARSETLHQKPSYKNPYRRRRCLILSDGFYEWQKTADSKVKVPTYIRMKNHVPFALAGLWEIWRAQDGSEIFSTTIITTEPNELLKPIHNRMPVIISPDSYQTWLSPNEKKPDELSHLLKPYGPGAMEAFPVSRAVNNPATDSPTCIQPL